MLIQENISIGSKTTMRIGGNARYFAELVDKKDVEEALAFAQTQNLPFIMLGSGSNTIFADGTVNALVVRLKNSELSVSESTVRVNAGKNLAMLINELAKQNLDLSPLTGIPGTIGGAIFGNAGQGPQGIWIGSFVKEVTAYMDGAWKTFDHDACEFAYRESMFKHHKGPLVIWDVALEVPSRPQAQIEAEVQALLQKRIETQPHMKTAGSCFKAVNGIPAWKLIDAQGMRGYHVGEVQIAEKHANFLLNMGKASFSDAMKIVKDVQEKIPGLEVEMRFVKEDGTLAF
jgi:UDP-N-acetylmuramate dehydrogenase